MKMTEYIAIYAAIIATSTFIWNIVTWILNKRKLKLECRFVVMRGTIESPHVGEFIEYKILNVSDKPLRVSSISGTTSTPNGKGYFSLASTEIPRSISPMDSFSLYKEAPHIFNSNLRSLHIEDSVGRIYKMKRSSLKKLKRKGETYPRTYEDQESVTAYNPSMQEIN
ncbi:hypothetical protein [Paenibacillus sp. NPDC057934]|uniref:hypothetical protein n=1 Tax=Paenibacillus sp. NPDC057934 TaxID=3346282 RepID=UPI0036DB03AD